jgi:hypothetical protein
MGMNGIGVGEWTEYAGTHSVRDVGCRGVPQMRDFGMAHSHQSMQRRLSALTRDTHAQAKYTTAESVTSATIV